MAPKKHEVSPIATHVAEAILKKPIPVEEDTMTEVEPSVSADPPPPHHFTLPLPRSISEKVFLKAHPFPCKFDCAKIKKWLSEAKMWASVSVTQEEI